VPFKDGDTNEFGFLAMPVQNEVTESSFSAARMAVLMAGNDMKIRQVSI
jgi:hypothetical protein